MIKIKHILQTIIVLVFVLAFILSSIALVINDKIDYINENMWKGKKRVDISKALNWSPIIKELPVSKDDNIAISGWADGEARRPSITMDSLGNVFVTYQFDQDLFNSPAGFAWNPNPLDQEAWWNNGIAISPEGIDMLYYPDTAVCEHPDYELMNVFVAIDTEEVGGIYIPDVTDYNLWEYYTWDNEAPDPEFAAISDGGWYQDIYHEDVIGPFNFYIYHGINDNYDIESCPIFFHNGIDAKRGVSYLDAQSDEKTAPSKDADYINLPDRMHTVICNTDTEKIIWKKIDPAVEADYEFTPFQATVADGTNPTIAAFDNKVTILYHNKGQIKSIYSSDDGETWSQPFTIGPGEYPDVYSYKKIFYAAYVNNRNLYLTVSKDGGLTWNDPVQINDVNGHVVAEENCVDVHRGGIVWVDDRELNGFQNIYYTELPLEQTPGPEIIIEEIKGGVGVKAVIKNIGSETAENFDWSIITEGTVFLKAEKTGQATLKPYESTTIKTGLMLGFGDIDITVIADVATKKVNAKLLLFLVAKIEF